MNKNHIFIGNNLDVMQSKEFKKFYNKIKMIYIDPPYNTKTNKSYIDNYCSNDWAIFIKQRLVIAKELLTDNGVIFISIDDNEQANLKIICDEIFGKDNFIGTFITKQSLRSNAKQINTIHEYILCFSKNKKKVSPFKTSRLLISRDKAIISSLYKKVNKLIKPKDMKELVKK